jgi:parallel beta-helix repeat protein
LNVVNPTAPVAFAAGNAIYSDQGLFNATIDDNSFTGQSNATIILIGGGTAVGGANSFQANVTITDNDLLNDAAIILANTTSSKIDGNSIHGSTGSAIFLAGGVNRVDITNNDIRDTAFTGINVRFLPGGATAGGYNVAIPDFLNFISGNFIKNSGDAGIRLRDMANGNTVASNTVVNTRATTDPTGSPPTAGFGDGITIEGSAYNTVRDNIVRASGGYGIALLLNPGTNAFNPFGTVSFSNTVSGNTVANNALAGVIVIGDGLFNAGVTNRVQSNTATQNVDGFVLLSASGVTLRSNTINQSSEDGVRLSNSKNNSLSQNGSFNNGRDGFRVQTTSSGNSLTSNSAFGNDDFDFFDNTVGAGSGGTANTYSSNHGDRANVSGLVH